MKSIDDLATAFKRSQGMRSTEERTPASTSLSIAVIGFALGLAVAVYTTRKDEYFLANFACTWLPQVAALGVAFLCKARPASLGGIALAMALYLYLFDIWVTESMGWLIYLFSFPGILVGALLAAFFTPPWKPLQAPIAFCWVVLGIVLGVVCVIGINT